MAPTMAKLAMAATNDAISLLMTFPPSRRARPRMHARPARHSGAFRAGLNTISLLRAGRELDDAAIAKKYRSGAGQAARAPLRRYGPAGDGLHPAGWAGGTRAHAAITASQNPGTSMEVATSALRSPA
jgi:hypothetical protein